MIDLSTVPYGALLRYQPSKGRKDDIRFLASRRGGSEIIYTTPYGFGMPDRQLPIKVMATPDDLSLVSE